MWASNNGNRNTETLPLDGRAGLIQTVSDHHDCNIIAGCKDSAHVGIKEWPQEDADFVSHIW